MAGDILEITSLEQLKLFFNDEELLEICTRGAKKRFKSFQKIVIKESPLEEITSKTFEAVSSLSNLSKVSIGLNAVNLCVTCAGFAMVNEKLKHMSADVNRCIVGIEDVKNRQHANDNIKFDDISGIYADMLDRRRREDPFSSQEMHDLVHKLYVTLRFYIDVFNSIELKDVEIFLNVIYSLLAMMTVSLNYYDEQYYFENKEKNLGKNPFHTSHTEWMNIYEQLSSREFIEKIQDYAFLEKDMSAAETDIYYSELLNQVKDMREEVEDNQTLIQIISDVAKLGDYRKATNQLVTERIDKLVDEDFEDAESSEATAVRNVLKDQYNTLFAV